MLLYSNSIFKEKHCIKRNGTFFSNVHISYDPLEDLYINIEGLSLTKKSNSTY